MRGRTHRNAIVSYFRYAMRTRQRTIHGLHSAVELAVGVALLAIPFALGFAAPGLVASVALGALLIGLALAGTSASGRASLAPSVHADLDLGMAIGLLAAAVVLGLGGHGVAFAVLVVSGVIELVLTAVTRYSAVTA